MHERRAESGNMGEKEPVPEPLARDGAGEMDWGPLKLRRLPAGERPEEGSSELLEVSWGKRRYRFALAIKDWSTPKVVAEAIRQARAGSRPPRLWPLIVVPYLSGEQLGKLEAEGVSGMDLGGNGVLIIPGELLVLRTGKPNLFPQSFPIKNVYRKTSSIPARVFLARPEYPAVKDVLAEVRRRGGAVALSTVSKVLSRLEDDLIIGRSGDAIRLLQPDKLLERLIANYTPPDVTGRWLGKYPPGLSGLMARLSGEHPGKTQLVVAGASSAARYAVMAREETVTVYCRSLKRTLKEMGPEARETDRFADVQLLETADGFVYFDARPEAGWWWASPVQTYLELAKGDKREQETAEQVEGIILREARGRDTTPEVR